MNQILTSMKMGQKNNLRNHNHFPHGSKRLLKKNWPLLKKRTATTGPHSMRLMKPFGFLKRQDGL